MIKLFENMIKSEAWRIKDSVKDTHKKSIIYETRKWIEPYDTSQPEKRRSMVGWQRYGSN